MFISDKWKQLKFYKSFRAIKMILKINTKSRSNLRVAMINTSECNFPTSNYFNV